MTSSGVDNRTGGPLRLFDLGPPIIVTEFHLGSLKKNPKYCLVSEEQNPAPPPPQKKT
jgi:hypothetical protein